MTENQKLLQALEQATNAYFWNNAMEHMVKDTYEHAQACKWLSSPGSRVEVRVDMGGLVKSTLVNVRAVIVDSGGEPLWEMFRATTPNTNT
jgi:hypothetical protein